MIQILHGDPASPLDKGLRDRVSSRFVAYALGSPLEDHDEKGIHADPHFGENNTFYLQAMATSPTVQTTSSLRITCWIYGERVRSMPGSSFSRP